MTGEPSRKNAEMLDRALNCLRQGRFQDAAGLLEQVFDAEPENPAAHHLAGLMHHQRGLVTEAHRYLEQAVKGAPGNPEFHLNLGVVLGNLGRVDDAIGHYRTALSLAPGTPVVLANLGFALSDKGDHNEALDAFGQALSAEPGHIGAQLGFAHILGGLRAGHYSQELESALLRAFGLAHANHAELAAASAHQLGLKYGLSETVPGDKDVALKVAQDALFEAFLTRCVNIDVAMENFLTGLRRRLVLAPHGSHSADALKVAALLAVQGFINEYIFFRQADETEAAAKIKNRLEEALAAGADATLIREPALIYAMVGPLSGVRGAETLAGLDSESLGPDLDRLVQLTLRDHLAERALQEKIETLSPITDSISKAVRAQYEENPYPRWLHAPAQQPTNLGALLGEMFPHFAPGGPPSAFGPSPDILIAGSGTGHHVAHVARTHPQANILAIDLSKASIAYAMRMMEKLEISNVRFMQADILEAAAIGDDFDMIQSVGVLHHMEDPLRGWRVLAGLLRPGGVFKLGLYSDRDRGHVRECRRLIETLGIGSSADDIAAFRHKLMTGTLGGPDGASGPGGDFARIIETSDFFTTSMCRDLLFHVHEQHTTPKQIKRDLDELGLEFIGFEQFEEGGINDAYREAYPLDVTLTDLDNWDALEAAHGGFFGAGYLLWCRKPE